MNVRSTTVAAIIVGGLMAGLGATPAMASDTSPKVVAAASSRSATANFDGHPAKGSLALTTTSTASAPVVPGAPALPPETSPRFLPVLLALGRAFVAAVKVVPAAYAKLAPAVRAGASAVGKYVKNNAPAAAKAIVSGVSTSALYEILKNIFGF